ncbi:MULTISPECIES: hypothetical protein [Chlorobium]|uniref:hypothetical protein n=1 Tax=Chlorobium TaxID=1091 RepID=UPI001E624314|nr:MULTISPECIES: hypothetical protein [Chlorobium]
MENFAYSAIQWAFENSLFFFNISELKKLSIIKQQNNNPAMKKLFIFLFLASTVSFVGCAKKAEAPVEAPAAEAAPAAPAAEAAPAAPAAEAAPAAPAAEAAPAAPAAK